MDTYLSVPFRIIDEVSRFLKLTVTRQFRPWFVPLILLGCYAARLVVLPIPFSLTRKIQNPRLGSVNNVGCCCILKPKHFQTLKRRHKVMISGNVAYLREAEGSSDLCHPNRCENQRRSRVVNPGETSSPLLVV